MSVKSIWLKIKEWSKGSLLIQAARVGLVLLLFCIILFVVLPHRAFFAANMMTNEIDIKDCTIGKADIDCSEANVSTGVEAGYIKFDNTVFEINGKQYDVSQNNTDWSIELVPSRTRYPDITIKALEDKIHFYKDGINGKMTLKKEQLYQNDYAKSEKKDNKETFSLKIGNDHVYYSGKLRLEMEGYNVRVMMNDTVEEYPDEKSIIIVFPQIVEHLQFVNSNSNTFVNPQINEVEIINQYDYSLYGSGDINIHYNPESFKYTVDKQELNIKSTYNTISTTISSDKDKQYKVHCSGYADSIVLSNNSLIPTFFNYLKENVYVIPTMFVTIIVGAISLIKTNKDNKKKEEKE